MRIDKPGIYDDVPMESYINDPCPEPSLSKGVIHTITERTALHARAEHPRLGGLKSEGGNDADTGSAIHGLVCGGAERIEWVPFNDYRKDDAKALRDDAHRAGRIPMLVKDQARIEDCAGRISEEITRRYGACTFEQTIVWQEKNGVWCRARPDIRVVSGELTVDLKTAKDAEPIQWARSSLAGSGYDIQAVHGTAGEFAVTGEVREFRFLIAEVEEPFGISEVVLDPAYVELANRKRERAIRIWERCLRTNEWPGYPDRPHAVEPPPYKVFEFENRVLSQAVAS